MDSNIPKSIFYSALDGEFLSIARSSLLYKDFNEKAMELRGTFLEVQKSIIQNH